MSRKLPRKLTQRAVYPSYSPASGPLVTVLMTDPADPNRDHRLHLLPEDARRLAESLTRSADQADQFLAADANRATH